MSDAGKNKHRPWVGDFRRKDMRRRFTLVLVIIVLSTIASLNIVSAENWPQWRGPALNGVSDEKNLPVKWTTEENITWKLEMPGWSGSTPIKIGRASCRERREGPQW